MVCLSSFSSFHFGDLIRGIENGARSRLMDAFDLPPICPPPANDLVPMLVIIGVVVGFVWIRENFSKEIDQIVVVGFYLEGI